MSSYNNSVDVRRRKYVFLARLRQPEPQARVEMSSEKGQKEIYARNINSITIIIISESIEKRNY